MAVSYFYKKSNDFLNEPVMKKYEKFDVAIVKHNGEKDFFSLYLPREGIKMYQIYLSLEKKFGYFNECYLLQTVATIRNRKKYTDLTDFEIVKKIGIDMTPFAPINYN
jgi:hypothetical protein